MPYRVSLKILTAPDATAERTMLAHTLCIAALLLVVPTCAQNIDYNFSTAGSEDTAFKPKYPLNCRTLEFQYWAGFLEANGPGAARRCTELYEDMSKQPGAFSTESHKICLESYAEYAEAMRRPDGTVEMFCKVATLKVDSKKVSMSHHLESKLASSAISADHDVYRFLESWVDSTNLRLMDEWTRGLYAGDAPQELNQDCIDAFSDFACTKTFPNCTYMRSAKWPYNELEEKIYICRETCDKVVEFCSQSWLPYPVRCKDFVSNKVDLGALASIDALNDPRKAECTRFGLSSCEGLIEKTPYEIRAHGGHACASARAGQIGGAPSRPWVSMNACVAVLFMWGMLR